MPVRTFTNADDSYSVTSPGDYTLLFLDGSDRLTVAGGTMTTAVMGEGDDLATLRSGTATVFGESGDDRFDVWAANAAADGGGGNDLFNLRGGSNVTVAAGAGVDRINFYAGAEAVFVDGGDGSDDFFGYNYAITGELHGGSGNDYFIEFRGAGLTIYGGSGNDIYRADATAPANFVEDAGAGLDSVQVARGDSYTLAANLENISVHGFSGTTGNAATLRGNALGNTINAHNNADTLFGLGGNDHLSGKGANDLLWGGSGNDFLDGGSGNDGLNGEAGDDILNGRTGDDAMAGGIGDDTYYVDNLSDMVTEASGEGIDLARVSVTDYVLPDNVDNGFVFGSAGITLTANALDNLLVASADGADTLVGLDGNDTLKARGAASDFLYGSAGDDRLYAIDGGAYMAGGLGNDSYYFNTSIVQVDETSGDGIDTVYADFSGILTGIFTLPQFVENGVITGTNDGELHGNGSDNSLTGGSGVDRLYGDAGYDAIDGGAGVDFLFGDDGFDTMFGGDGDDFITGGAGLDGLSGGSGADAFIYDAVSDSPIGLLANDSIEDFEGATDVIDLFAIDANTTLAGNQSFIPLGAPTGSPCEVWVVDSGSGIYTLFADVDGGGADFRINIHVVSGTFTLNDLVL